MEYPKAIYQWCSDKYQESPDVYGSAVGALNHVPLVGHIKGGIHYAYGDKSEGNSAMEAATRSTAVVGGGMGGMAVAGPVGAAAGAVAGGAISDAVATAVDSQANQAYIPHGVVKLMDKEDQTDKWQSIGGVVARDALVGTASAAISEKVVSGASNVDVNWVASSTAGLADTWKRSASSAEYIMKKYEESLTFCDRHEDICSTISTGWNRMYGVTGKTDTSSEK